MAVLGQPDTRYEQPHYQEIPQNTRVQDQISLPFSDTANQEIIRWQLETEQHLLDIEMRLQGRERRWNTKKQDYVYNDVRKPFMNEQGIGRMMSIVRTMINMNTILSDYSKEEAYTTIIDVVSACLDTLYMERVNFSTKKADLPLIRAIIENGIKATMFRAVEGATMEYLRGSHRTISSTIMQSQGQGGILKKLGSVFRW